MLGDVATDEVNPNSAVGPKDTEQVQVRELEEQGEDLRRWEDFFCSGEYSKGGRWEKILDQSQSSGSLAAKAEEEVQDEVGREILRVLLLVGEQELIEDQMELKTVKVSLRFEEPF